MIGSINQAYQLPVLHLGGFNTTLVPLFESADILRRHALK